MKVQVRLRGCYTSIITCCIDTHTTHLNIKFHNIEGKVKVPHQVFRVKRRVQGIGGKGGLATVDMHQ